MSCAQDDRCDMNLDRTYIMTSGTCGRYAPSLYYSLTCRATRFT